MRIAVEGCAHGELEIIYDAIQEIEKVDGKKIDLLLCCGDFQSTRNLTDLKCMAVPDKYKDICTFYKYYSGEKIAPILTLFIGGNHEASNFLQELPYGGWVAPNIYYLGYASVVTIGGIRIAGISGIYKGQDWMQGHYEKPPYTESTVRSVYHIRNLEVFRLKQLSGNIDIFLSHDWPSGVTKYGDENRLLRGKPYFKNDIESNMLGSPPSMELLEHHHPSFWFSAHLHCKFAALIPEKGGTRLTKFLALDKCLPKRKFLQVIELPHNHNSSMTLHYDLEWLAILYLTNHLLSVKNGTHYMPGQSGDGRWIYTPTEIEKENVLNKFNYDLEIPNNFKQTVKPYNSNLIEDEVEAPRLIINNQTTEFCNILGIDDPSILLQLIIDSKESKSNDTTLETTFESILNSSYPATFEGESTLEFSSPVINSSPKNSIIDHDLDNINHKINTDTGSNKSNVNIVHTDSIICNSSHLVNIEPNCKKFKRRNYSIYSNTL